MRKPNLRIIGIEESKESQLKEPVNIFNKIMEENFPTLKNEKTTCNNNNNRGEQRLATKKPTEYLQQNHRRKLSYP